MFRRTDIHRRTHTHTHRIQPEMSDTIEENLKPQNIIYIVINKK